MGHRYLDNQNNSPLLRLPAGLRAIIFRHVCDTLTLHLHENVALQDLELQRSRCQGVARPGTPRPDSVFQLQGVKSGAPLLAVCCKINEEVNEFVNDIRVTRLEKGALCTAKKNSYPVSAHDRKHADPPDAHTELLEFVQCGSWQSLFLVCGCRLYPAAAVE